MSGAGQMKGDVLFPSWFIEAKATKKASPLAWLLKATQQAGGKKCYVAWNPGDSRNAVAIMWLSDLEALLEAASLVRGATQEDGQLLEDLKALLAAYSS